MWTVPLYAGLQWLPHDEDGPELVEITTSPLLVEREDWERMQRPARRTRRAEFDERVAAHGRAAGSRTSRRTSATRAASVHGQRPSKLHLLSGLMRCARCGSPCTRSATGGRGTRTSTGRRYRCGARARTRTGCATRPLVDAALVEAPFVRHFEGLTLDASAWLRSRATDREGQRERLVAMVEQAA